MDLDEPADFASEYEGKDETRKALTGIFITCLHKECSEGEDEGSG